MLETHLEEDRQENRGEGTAARRKNLPDWIRCGEEITPNVALCPVIVKARICEHVSLSVLLGFESEFEPVPAGKRGTCQCESGKAVAATVNDGACGRQEVAAGEDAEERPTDRTERPADRTGKPDRPDGQAP